MPLGWLWVVGLVKPGSCFVWNCFGVHVCVLCVFGVARGGGCCGPSCVGGF